jgi:lipopolysaccharide export system permease protein
MVVWFTSGQSLTNTLKPIMLFSAPFLVAILLLSLFLSPWAEQRKLEFERQLEQRDEVGVLAPGLFKEFKRAGLVVYVESLNPIDGRIRNVFLHSVDDAKDTTTVARLGHLEEAPNGDRFVVLENGSRYEGKPGTAEYQVIAFDKLGRRIEPLAVLRLRQDHDHALVLHFRRALRIGPMHEPEERTGVRVDRERR